MVPNGLMSIRVYKWSRCREESLCNIYWSVNNNDNDAL